jgi:hypothetical protein
MRARWFVVRQRYETRRRDGGIPTFPGKAREPACACSGDGKRTSRTRLPAGRTIPQAKRTATFWRSLDALAPTQKLSVKFEYSLSASKCFPASPTLGAGAVSACRKHRSVSGVGQSPGWGRRKFDNYRVGGKASLWNGEGYWRPDRQMVRSLSRVSRASAF